MLHLLIFAFINSKDVPHHTLVFIPSIYHLTVYDVVLLEDDSHSLSLK